MVYSRCFPPPQVRGAVGCAEADGAQLGVPGPAGGQARGGLQQGAGLVLILRPSPDNHSASRLAWPSPSRTLLSTTFIMCLEIRYLRFYIYFNSCIYDFLKNLRLNLVYSKIV